MKLLDPKNDFVFKTLFTADPSLLAALINAVRHHEPPVVVVDILNPHIAPAELTGKFIVLDLLAQDLLGRRYNIEMQVRRFQAWSARSAYYLARTLVLQLDGGADYHQLKPAIGIHLLDFELFTAATYRQQAVWCFELRDRHQPALRLGEELQLNLIERPKADRLGAGNPALAAWVAFLKHWQEETRMAQIDYPPVQQALERVRGLSADAETRRLAFVRERALRDQRSELRAAREEGHKAGHKAGRKEGREEGMLVILQRLLTQRFGPLDADLQQRLQTASPAQLETWAERVLEARDLEEVFAEH